MRIIRYIAIVLGVVVLHNFSFSQFTGIYKDKYKNYRDGLDLYDKDAFGAAQKSLKKLLILLKIRKMKYK